MLELSGDLGLLDEAPHHRLVAGVPRLEHLHRHIAAEVVVVAADDDTHPPAGDLLQRLVAGAAVGTTLRGALGPGLVAGLGLAQQDPRLRAETPFDLGEDAAALAGVRDGQDRAESGPQARVQPGPLALGLHLIGLWLLLGHFKRPCAADARHPQRTIQVRRLS